MAVSALTKSGNAGGGNYNPITGSFGRGVVVPFYKSGTFTAPFDGLYRVRVWGGGGGSDYAIGGGGGGFCMKVIDLKRGDEIAVVVGAGGISKQNGGTSSFGPHCSATGGSSSNLGVSPSASAVNLGGSGVGGDLNVSGGRSLSSKRASSNTDLYVCGGGAGSVYGDGGAGGLVSVGEQMMTYYGSLMSSHGSGGGKSQGSLSLVQSAHNLTYQKVVCLDQIGAGSGSAYSDDEMTASGGGGSQSSVAGFPAGGAGSKYTDHRGTGADGLVIVEY